MIEEWKDIKGYEGLYQVSNLGRVKSLKRGSIRFGTLTHENYLRLKLYKDGTYKNKNVHRLVAETFIPNPENKPTVNHIDEDKTNNMVSNLEWATIKENLNHGTRNIRASISKQKKIKAINIANGEYNVYNSLGECIKQLGISQTQFYRYNNGKRKHVGGYVFEYSK